MNKHDLEKSIFAAWNTVDDLKLLRESGLDDITLRRLDAVISLMDLRMDKLFKDFEKLSFNRAKTIREIDLEKAVTLRERDDNTDPIFDILYPVSNGVDDFYAKGGALSIKPYKDSQVNPHLKGTMKTVI